MSQVFFKSGTINQLENTPYSDGSLYAIPTGEENGKLYIDLNNKRINVTDPANGEITTEKLANGAVTTEKIANNAITTAKIIDNSITTPKLVDGVITDAKLDPNGIVNTITTSQLKAENIFYKGSILAGYYIDSDGEFQQNPLWNVSDFIPIDHWHTYICNNVTVPGQGQPSYAFFDEAYQFLEAVPPQEGTFELPTINLDIAYVCLSIHNDDLDDFKLSRIIKVESALANVGGQLVDGAVTTPKLANEAVTNAKLDSNGILKTVDTTQVYVENLFDQYDVTAGAYINTSGEVVEAADWNLSAPIPVDQVHYFEYKNWTGTSDAGQCFAFFDENEEFVSYVIPEDQYSFELIIPPTATTVRLSIPDNDLYGFRLSRTLLVEEALRQAKPANGSVGTTELADGAVTTNKLADRSVTTDKLATGAVTNAKIANGSIDTAKLDAAAVTQSKIADGNILTAKLANSAVTTVKIADDAVTTAKIANNAVTINKLGVDVIAPLELELTNTEWDRQVANGTYDGRDLIEILEATDEDDCYARLHQRAQSQDATDIRIGDYINVTPTGNVINQGNAIKYRVAGIAHNYNFGAASNPTPWGFWMVPDIGNDISGGSSILWRNTNDNNGTASERHPYLISELHDWEINEFLPALPTALQNILVDYYCLLEERYSANGTLTISTSATDAHVGKIFSLSETEVYGQVVYGSSYSVGDSAQLPLFKHSRYRRKDAYRWWLRSVMEGSDSIVCLTQGGRPFYYYPTLNTVLPCPCFIIA